MNGSTGYMIRIVADVVIVDEESSHYGRLPAHQTQRIILSHEKLCPVHRGFFAMSGRNAGLPGLDFETCKTTNPMARKRRLAPPQGFADNL